MDRNNTTINTILYGSFKDSTLTDENVSTNITDASTEITKTTPVSTASLFLWRGDHELWIEIIINIVVWFMWVATLVGNALVIAAFFTNRTIRNKVSNLYILNLAVSDFIIGFIPLGMNNVYRLSGIWPFGEKGCKLWLAVDFSACFVSVWAITLISYDRYVLVTKGLEYDKCQTRKKCAILSAITWIGCFMRYVVGFVGYDFWFESDVDYSVTCDSPILYVLPLIITDWVLSIILPVALIAFFNVIVYASIIKRSRGLPRNWANNIHPEVTTADVSTVQTTAGAVENVTGQATEQANSKAPTRRHEGTTDIRKLRRSAITLALVVGVSITCWGPYYSYIFATTLFNKQVDIVMIITTYYIWWGNSALNPFLFVATNPGIRRGVLKILRKIKCQ